MADWSYILAIICTSCLFIQFSLAQMMGMPPKTKYLAASKEVPYISCQVCEIAVEEIYSTVAKLRAVSPKVEEDLILTSVEKSCLPKEEQGSWIRRFDIHTSDGKLKLIDHGSPGKCKIECMTIAKACENTIGEIDTELGELLWRNDLTRDQLVNKVCHGVTSFCAPSSSKNPPKRDDEIFETVTEEEMKMEEMMQQMGGMPGMPGMEMYTKDDMEAMKGQMGHDPSPSGAEAPEPHDTGADAPPDDIPPRRDVTLKELLTNTVTNSWNWLLSKVGYGKAKEEL